MKNNVLYILMFFTLFFFNHYETEYLFDIKIAQIWKFGLLLILIAFTYRKRIHYITLIAFLLSFKYLLITGYDSDFATQLDIFGRSLTFPVIFHFILSKKFNPEKVIRFLANLSVFLIVSTIPYLANLLEASGRAYDLTKYGNAGETSFIGFFQSPHYAGITIASASVFIVWLVMNNRVKNNKLYLVLALLGGYIVIITYVRTAIVMYILGIAFVLFRRFSMKTILSFVLSSFILLFTFDYFYSNNSAFARRINGETIYNEDNNFDVNKFSSGRATFIETNLKSWGETDILSKFLGMGVGKSMDLMEMEIGKRKVSHNGFVNVLTYSGLLGVFLFVYWIILIYRKILRSETFSKLGYIFLGLLLLLNLFQGDNWFFFDVFLACVFSLPLLEENFNKKTLKE